MICLTQDINRLPIKPGMTASANAIRIMEPEVTQLLQEILTELRRQNNGGAPVREIMSIAQAAEYLDVSEYTLREWARLRKIPHMKVNGSIRFRKSKLDKWLDRQEIGIIS